MQINIGKRYYIIRRAGWFNIAIASGDIFTSKKGQSKKYLNYNLQTKESKTMSSPIHYPLRNRRIEKWHINNFIHVYPEQIYFENVVIKGVSLHPDNFKVYGLICFRRNKKKPLMVYGINDEIE